MTCGPFTANSPVSPIVTSFPSDPKIHTSVDETGNPILPLYSFKVGGLIATQGDVSVNPYASSKGLPVTVAHFSATARCTAIPPPKLILSALKSNSANLGVFNNMLNNVLTPVITVNLHFAISEIK